MLKPPLILLLVCGLVLVSSVSAPAQTPEVSVPALTLNQVMAMAEANYPAIKAAQAQQRAAHEEIAVARTAYLPRADILWQTDRATANNVLGLTLPQSTIPSVTGSILPADPSRSAWNSTGGALVSWQPFDFGARGAKVEVARRGNEAARQVSLLTKLQVCADAASVFFEIAAAQQLVAVAEENVRRYESFDKVVHVLVENTLRPGADESQADAQLAIARNQLIQAQTQVTVKRATLAEYLQINSTAAEINPAAFLSSMPVTDVPGTAAADHPFVLEERALGLQQEAQKRALDRSYVPVFSTSGVVFGRGAGTSTNGPFPGGTAGLAPNTLNWAAGVQVTFAAFDFFSLRDQRSAAEANVQAQHFRWQQATSHVAAAVEQAQATLAGARLLAANTPVELTAAQTGEQQQQARYRAGLASIVDVAAAESLLAQAQGDEAIARLSVWRAELGLAVAQGDLQPFLQALPSQAKGK